VRHADNAAAERLFVQGLARMALTFSDDTEQINYERLGRRVFRHVADSASLPKSLAVRCQAEPWSDYIARQRFADDHGNAGAQGDIDLERV
jgi:hypothetical protein